MKKTLAIFAVSVALISTGASANTLGIEVKFDDSELPYFGISADWIRNTIAQQLQSNGHTVVDRSQNPNVLYVYAHFAAWSTKIDGGQTLLGKSEGILLLVEPLKVVTENGGKKKAVETTTVWAATKHRLCNGIATDDRRSVLQNGFQRCISNFVNAK